HCANQRARKNLSFPAIRRLVTSYKFDNQQLKQWGLRRSRFRQTRHFVWKTSDSPLINTYTSQGQKLVFEIELHGEL
ncbi:MAG: hypothetical protein WAR77_02365, partial [Saprospiraceae bacterium]